jgi:aspartate aminotransferase
MLATRTKSFATSGTATARAAARAAAGDGKPIIDLTAGEILAPPPPALRAGAIAAVEAGIGRYTDTIGLPELREAVARRLAGATGQTWHADEIALTAGAKQSLFNAAMVVLDPGDEVIIPAPYWTTFPAQVVIAGGKPVFLDTRASGYVPQLEHLRAAITPATRAIIVNTPGNPSGVVFDRATLAGIAELAIQHDLWVVFDECYGTFAFEPYRHEHIVSIVPEVRSRTLIVNSFSKALAITGWRLGYLAGPREVIKAAKALQSHTTSNPNAIAQHAVLTYLEKDDDAYERELHAQLLAARRHGLQILASLARIPPPHAHGGFYFYLDLSALLTNGRTTDDIVGTLLARAGVAGVSGTAFGDPAGLRLSYGVPLDLLDDGLTRLVAVLHDLEKGLST